MRPIPDPRHQPVLERVDMNVVDVTSEIVLIANGVLPIATLPDTALAFGGAAGRNPLTECGASGKMPF